MNSLTNVVNDHNHSALNYSHLSGSVINNNMTTTAPMAENDKSLCYSENIAVLVLAAFGLVGNILSIAVIHHSRIKTSYSFLLQMLSVADALQLLGTFIHVTKDISSHTQCENTFSFSNIEDIAMSVIYLFCDMAQLISHWLLVQLSVDRFIAICRPFAAVHWCTIPKSIRGMLIIIVGSLIMTIPHGVDLLVYHTRQHDIVYIIADMTMRYYVPITLLLFLNTKLIIAIKRVSSRTVCQSHNSRSASLNLIVVVVVFLICGICRGTDLILFYALNNPHDNQRFLIVFSSVTYILMIFNSAINFLIYCMFYRKFRTALKALCCKVPVDNSQFSTMLN